jgi:hypothetical protein
MTTTIRSTLPLGLIPLATEPNRTPAIGAMAGKAAGANGETGTSIISAPESG